MKGKIVVRTECIYIKDENGDDLTIDTSSSVKAVAEQLSEITRAYPDKHLLLYCDSDKDCVRIYYEVELTQDEVVKQEIDDLMLRVSQYMKSLHEHSSDYIRRVDCDDIEIPNDIDKMNLVELANEIFRCNRKSNELLENLYVRKTND